MTASSWKLILYIAGQTPNGLAAQRNLRQICDEFLVESCTVEVVDLARQPELAEEHQIIALPTLVRKSPLPVVKIVGNLSKRDKVLASLDLEVDLGIFKS